MAALLVSLLGAALAAIGGRWWMLARTLPRQRWALPATILSAIAIAAGASASGAWIGAQVRGPGMLLFLALALLFTGAGALWSARGWAARKEGEGARGPGSALILLLATGVSDGGAFLILSVAAWTRDPLLAGAGGACGMAAAAMMGEIGTERLAAARAAIAALFLGTGACLALVALGLV